MLSGLVHVLGRLGDQAPGIASDRARGATAFDERDFHAILNVTSNRGLDFRLRATNHGSRFDVGGHDHALLSRHIHIGAREHGTGESASQSNTFDQLVEHLFLLLIPKTKNN